MDQDINPERRFWFVIDELAAFKNLRELETSAAELRKYGGCILTATQNISQLQAIYGYPTTRSIIDQFKTKFFFNGTVDNDLISSCFGNIEVARKQESISYGAHEMRDGVNISQVSITKPLITSSDIANLAPLSAFVTLPCHFLRFAKVAIPFVKT
jgi:type IV secretory pathway TraG/TraD family ATPase VirD4